MRSFDTKYVYLLDIDLGFNKWHQEIVKLYNSPHLNKGDWVVIRVERTKDSFLTENDRFKWLGRVSSYQRRNIQNQRTETALAR